MKRIVLRGGRLAIVDDDDYARLMQWRWSVRRGRGYTMYAHRREGPRGASKSVHMHRVIMRAPEGAVVDHINGNGLDNRKENLRVCSQSVNMLNVHRLRKDNTSGHRRVHYDRQLRRWRVYTNQFMGKSRYVGCFKTKREAIEAAKKAGVNTKAKKRVTRI